MNEKIIKLCKSRITEADKAEEKLRADPNTAFGWGLQTLTILETRRQCYKDILECATIGSN